MLQQYYYPRPAKHCGKWTDNGALVALVVILLLLVAVGVANTNVLAQPNPVQ